MELWVTDCVTYQKDERSSEDFISTNCCAELKVSH